jgi:hypothetical protein
MEAAGSSTAMLELLEPVRAVVLKKFTSEPPLTRENTFRPPPPVFFYKNRSHGMFDILFCVFLPTI